jgi:L-aspartate oxidase
MNKPVDFLVIGSGLAGLAFALKVADHATVCIISKTQLETGNTEMAQGGIAAVIAKDDSLEKHENDTLYAGAGLCDVNVVRNVVSQGADRILDLVAWGVNFDKKGATEFSLTKEGGHSNRRILHVEDHTGLDVQRQLLKRVREHPNISLRENHIAAEIITNKRIKPRTFSQDRALGAYILNKDTGHVYSQQSQFTILASGGAGRSYLYTSNWDGATGDGVAMAYLAGARIANLEFMQFHPTCLFHPQARNFLISEALRGEGGELINKNGVAFMKNYHSMGSLAPRDIVARSIDAEMKQTGKECVYLDMTHLDSEFVKNRFPQIYDRCFQLGIDITTQPIPVVPAAHYLCGGVLTGINGETDIMNLYALGETACTGLHGANRLASNSLLECLVFSHNAAIDTLNKLKQNNEVLDYAPMEWPTNAVENADELVLISQTWDEIRRLMWAYVGIVRTDKRLERAHKRIQLILKELDENYSSFKTHSDILEVRNIAIFADLTIRCAMMRKESRGIHYNLDWPQLNEVSKDTIISKNTNL